MPFIPTFISQSVFCIKGNTLHTQIAQGTTLKWQNDVLTALSFTQVNVFGFGASSTGTWHHYFDKSHTHYKGGPHKGDIENVTIHQLLHRNKISIYKGY